jgi:hypothetical protein
LEQFLSCEINEANAAFDAAAFGRLCCGPGRCTASWCCGQCVADTTSCCGGSRLLYCAIRLGQYQPSWRDRLTLAPLRFAFAQPPSDTNIVLPADEAKSSSIPDMPAAVEIQAAMDKPSEAEVHATYAVSESPAHGCIGWIESCEPSLRGSGRGIGY